MSDLALALTFKAWKRFHAKKGDYHKFLVDLARKCKSAFIQGMRSGKSGRHHPGLPRQSSAPGEYPAVQFGRLRGSIFTKVSNLQMTIGTRTPYSGFLTTGTSRMAPRKMSKEALEDGMKLMNKKLLQPAHWERG